MAKVDLRKRTTYMLTASGSSIRLTIQRATRTTSNWESQERDGKRDGDSRHRVSARGYLVRRPDRVIDTPTGG